MYDVKPRVLPRHVSPKPKMWLIGSQSRSTSLSSRSGALHLSQSQPLTDDVAVRERDALRVAAGAARVEHHPRLVERDAVHRALEGARVLLVARAAHRAARVDHGEDLALDLRERRAPSRPRSRSSAATLRDVERVVEEDDALDRARTPPTPRARARRAAGVSTKTTRASECSTTYAACSAVLDA